MPLRAEERLAQEVLLEPLMADFPEYALVLCGLCNAHDHADPNTLFWRCSQEGCGAIYHEACIVAMPDHWSDEQVTNFGCAKCGSEWYVLGENEHPEPGEQVSTPSVPAKSIPMSFTQDADGKRLTCTVVEEDGMPCGKTFLYKQSLERHHQYKHENLTYPCSVCGKVFMRKESMMRHRTTSHRLRLYKCPVCDKPFGSNEHVKAHYYAVHDPETLKCPHCEGNFSLKVNLAHHIAQFHEKGSNPAYRRLKCTECGRTYTSKYNLARHVQESHNKKKDDAANKKKHRPNKRSRTASSQFKCEDCQMFFATKGTLTRHRRNLHSHEGTTNDDDKDTTTNGEDDSTDEEDTTANGEDAPTVESSGPGYNEYMCEECDKPYRRKASLMRHLKNCHSQDEADDEEEDSTDND
ncbi:uncharacterized protein BO97DRAFT_428304 [Aspergillus homomorphus CBS 101889]|uniref:C2H2-type domain-containing protein n=1 Tax=Aspergillus homomorphus (strain CBS 101889) TaxID=1450537 RepID=A0A395HNR0_ASPHC|nr:hypothetical protein BO97DRAFT_428304 [Aspergillus homomorphus CBS 101889]RAL08478.1 hypothetical protein BO97DRAFT_428304 [Aspergillus homomorphus CBS 101889]